MHSLKDRENLQKSLHRKVDSAVRGERMAQQKLYEAEAEAEARNWEKRNSDISLHEINQEFESQRFQLRQARRWADQAQRDKISLYGELELRTRLFHEDHARDCQETEELRRSCFEETDRARQARNDELSLPQERNPTTVSQLMTQAREWQNKVNSLSDAREIYDHESGSSSRATHVSEYTSTILSPRTLSRCDSGLPHDAQNGYGYYRIRFWTTTCSRRTILYNLQQFQEFGIFLWGIDWDLKLQELQGEERVEWKENRWIRQSFYSISKVEVVCWIILVELILTMVWWIIRDQISRLYGMSKLEGHFQEWGLSKNSRSSNHFVLDQRSWDCQIN